MKTTLTTYLIVVPIPTLPPETDIGELPTVDVPVKTGTVFVLPLPVTVCAAAPADANAKTKPSHMHADFVIFLNPFVSFISCSRPFDT
jgi:hypothetical protein